MPTDSIRKAVYIILEREGQKSFFIRVGTAFTNRDGSLNLYLDALPLGGKLHVRDIAAKEPDETPATAVVDAPAS